MRTVLPKLFAFGLIIGSIIFSILILKNDPVALTTAPGEVSAANGSNSNEKLADVVAVDENNLTMAAAQKISQQLALPNVQSVSDLQQPEKVADEYLAESAKNFNYASLKPKVAADQLKIVPTADRRLWSMYIKGINDAMLASAGNVKLDKNEMAASLASLSAAYGATIQILYQVPVPQVFSQLHQDIIANLGGQKAATDMIRQNYQTDPVRALLAVEAMTKFNQELTAIQSTIQNIATGKKS